MSLNRYAKNKDANQKAVVAALVAVGCDVLVLDAFDLLVHRAGKLFMLEVKDGAKKPSARQLKPSQKRLIARGWPLHVVLSPADALRAVGFVDMRARIESNARAVDAKVAATLAAVGGGT